MINSHQECAAQPNALQLLETADAFSDLRCHRWQQHFRPRLQLKSKLAKELKMVLHIISMWYQKNKEMKKEKKKATETREQILTDVWVSSNPGKQRGILLQFCYFQ